jgi:hypothetical protein
LPSILQELRAGCSTEVVGEGGGAGFGLSEEAAQLDVAAVVEDDAGGLEVAGLDLVGLELAAGVEDGVEQVPDLDRGRRASLSLNFS